MELIDNCNMIDMETKSYGRLITNHKADIELLREKIDILNQAIESGTSEAYEGLLKYRELKHQAAMALQGVAKSYQKARSLYNRTDQLIERFGQLKNEHNEICSDILNLSEIDPQQAEPYIENIKLCEKDLKALVPVLEDMRKETRYGENCSEIETEEAETITEHN